MRAVASNHPRAMLSRPCNRHGSFSRETQRRIEPVRSPPGLRRCPGAPPLGGPMTLLRKGDSLIFKYGIYLPRNDGDPDRSPERVRWNSGRQLEWLRLKDVDAFEYDWTKDRLSREHPQYAHSNINLAVSIGFVSSSMAPDRVPPPTMTLIHLLCVPSQFDFFTCTSWKLVGTSGNTMSHRRLYRPRWTMSSSLTHREPTSSSPARFLSLVSPFTALNKARQFSTSFSTLDSSTLNKEDLYPPHWICILHTGFLFLQAG
jgi:hypothetical protein